jgi:hypothetical protein
MYLDTEWAGRNESLSLRNYHINDNSFVIRMHEMVHGRNKHSGKDYVRLEKKPRKVVIAKRSKDGRIYYIHRTANGAFWGGRGALFHWGDELRRLSVNDEWKKNLKHGRADEIISGTNSFRFDYTAYSDTPWNSILNIPSGVMLSQLPPDQVVKSLYGKKNYRKDLMRAAAKTNAHALYYGSLFANHLPMERVIEFFNSNSEEVSKVITAEMADRQLKRYVMSRVSEKSARRLLFSDTTTPYYLRDTVRMATDTYTEFDKKSIDVGNWRELHDTFVQKVNERRFGVEFTNHPRLDALIKNMGGEYYTYRLAANWQELSAWGKEMGNCVSSYGQMIQRGNCVVGGVFDPSGKMIANFELRPPGAVDSDSFIRGMEPQPRLAQLLGRFNSNLPREVCTSVEYDFFMSGVDINGYWGKPEQIVDEPEFNVFPWQYDRIEQRPALPF